MEAFLAAPMVCALMSPGSRFGSLAGKLLRQARLVPKEFGH